MTIPSYLPESPFPQQISKNKISVYTFIVGAISTHQYFKSYLVIGNLTMIKTNCYNVSQTQRPIDDRFEFCKKRKY